MNVNPALVEISRHFSGLAIKSESINIYQYVRLRVGSGERELAVV
jgi:hypothetical protein